MGYVDKGDKMANSYSISSCTLKWMKKLFFLLLYLAILNSYIVHSSCGGLTQKVFVKCRKYEVGLCVKKTCFEDYHTKARF